MSMLWFFVEGFAILPAILGFFPPIILSFAVKFPGLQMDTEPALLGKAGKGKEISLARSISESKKVS